MFKTILPIKNLKKTSKKSQKQYIFTLFYFPLFIYNIFGIISP